MHIALSSYDSIAGGELCSDTTHPWRLASHHHGVLTCRPHLPAKFLAPKTRALVMGAGTSPHDLLLHGLALRSAALYKRHRGSGTTHSTRRALDHIVPRPTNSPRVAGGGDDARQPFLRRPDVTILQFSDTTTKSDRHHPSGLTCQPSHIIRATHRPTPHVKYWQHWRGAMT